VHHISCFNISAAGTGSDRHSGAEVSEDALFSCMTMIRMRCTCSCEFIVRNPFVRYHRLLCDNSFLLIFTIYVAAVGGAVTVTVALSGRDSPQRQISGSVNSSGINGSGNDGAVKAADSSIAVESSSSKLT